MDYAPVKFMIKCFEANYPESLGSILVYKAPWVFQGIWKIIRGWLDPVVASKIHFVSDEAEMAKYIDQPRMLKELGGDENWEYKYLEPVPGENDRMSDHKTRDAILEERRNLSEEYERLTLAWARENDKEAAGQRERLANGLRDNYWRLDPYVRARSLWDRTGIIGKDGALNFYPSSIPATTTTATTTTATTQHAPVVNGPSSTVQNHSPPQQHHHQHDGTADLHSRTALLSIDGHHAHGGDVDGASIYSDARSHIDEELD
ncbi:hypothetical protein ANO11243_012510 [Dothideomycetidae sp. 11243]|nr:hypothetical protein ANO11243_012510 [fungal sp. No.11243]